MKSNELKQAIIDDLNTLKQLKIEIIPAKVYYAGLLKLAINAFWKIGLVVFLAILYVLLTDTKNSALTAQFYWQEAKDAALASVMMTLGALILLMPSLIHYYLIRYHLQQQLKTGPLLIKKLQFCGWLFWCVLALFTLMFASYADSAAIFFLISLAFIGSAFITSWVMGMEFNRVGLSPLFTVIKAWFNKDKTPP